MTAASTPQTTTWNLDPVHSVAEFKVKHMMISNVKGQFTGLSGSLDRHEGDLTRSSVSVSIDAASIGTRDAQRDAVQEAADRVLLAYGRRPTEEDKERGLVRVLGVGPVMQDAIADAQHHRPVPRQQGREGHVILERGEAVEQFRIRQ